MKNSRQTLIAAAALIAGLGMASGAHAAWTFTNAASTANCNSDPAPCAATTGTLGATGTPNESSTSVTVSGAYAVNNGTSNSLASGATWVQNATGTTGATSSTTGSQLLSFGGYGMGMASDGNAAPNHALDNNVNTETVVLQFGSSVTLNSIGLGYVSNGSTTSGTGACDSTTTGCSVTVDLSVWRYVGATAPTSAATALSGTGATLAAMNSAGWELVGNYGNFGVDTTSTYTTLSNTTKGSSWWLISAYNSAWGTTSADGGALDNGNDFFKLYAVNAASCTTTVGLSNSCNNAGTNSVSPMPEPTSLALVAIAGLGFLGARRRVQKMSAAV